VRGSRVKALRQLVRRAVWNQYLSDGDKSAMPRRAREGYKRAKKLWRNRNVP
jgi:hypothetical protein